jgi:hypothetical protein
MRTAYRHVKHDKPVILDMHGRSCNMCGKYKKWEQYHTYKDSPTGHRATCKECNCKTRRTTYHKKKSNVEKVVDYLMPELTPVNEFLMRRI